MAATTALPALIEPELLLLAYRSGIFPMADSRDDPEVFWVEPRHRAILPLDRFHCSRSLARVLRADRFTVTLDGDFAEVIAACAAPRPGHAESWISQRIAASYTHLHAAGHAHSIECRIGDELVGGLYGVAFDRVFCGESMFSRADNASKVALAWLVALMQRAGFELLDCQFLTDHLASLGAVEVSRAQYMGRLARAQGAPACSLAEAYASLLGEAAAAGAGSGAGAAGAAGAARRAGASPSPDSRRTGASSPGKLIAQSFTHTS